MGVRVERVGVGMKSDDYTDGDAWETSSTGLNILGKVGSGIVSSTRRRIATYTPGSWKSVSLFEDAAPTVQTNEATPDKMPATSAITTYNLDGLYRSQNGLLYLNTGGQTFRCIFSDHFGPKDDVYPDAASWTYIGQRAAGPQ